MQIGSDADGLAGLPGGDVDGRERGCAWIDQPCGLLALLVVEADQESRLRKGERANHAGGRRVELDDVVVFAVADPHFVSQSDHDAWVDGWRVIRARNGVGD